MYKPCGACGCQPTFEVKREPTASRLMCTGCRAVKTDWLSVSLMVHSWSKHGESERFKFAAKFIRAAMPYKELDLENNVYTLGSIDSNLPTSTSLFAAYGVAVVVNDVGLTLVDSVENMILATFDCFAPDEELVEFIRKLRVAYLKNMIV